ncbi:hypothetical protein Esi_0182_0003 [Ectocarpus siliculosus]|uniref:Uncharacterized protein n=1 Tax=Ectocarpus siliculosus TaxID=2880 RepID=D8LGW9_ECTSI|nr:hypothetical protein Esi_0182_0003 [Ectocarpus siliculosus]|eukprot:CBN75822.1 hypothetical protein Esi_0182_0003 [Ectocarpus siliculosus]
MTASAELQFANSRYERYTSAGGEPGPQRGMLASPSSPASFLSHLPSEAYTREISSRVGRHRRGKGLRRATPGRAAHRGSTGGEGFGLFQQHLRPLTGVSPPSTAQSAFRPADYGFESLRPTAPSAAAFGGHGGRSGRKNDISEGDLEKRAGAYPTPRTAGSSIDHNSKTHTSAAPLGRGKLNAHYQHNNDPHVSPGQGRGIMVPPDIVKAIKEGDKPRRNSGLKMDADALHCEKVEKEIAERFEVVAGGIEKLEDVFSGAAQILEHRVRAITTISSVIRMFLQRCRYLRGKEALRAWRTNNSLRVLQCMRHEVFRQKKIEAGLDRGVGEAGASSAARSEGKGCQEGGGQGRAGPVCHGCYGSAGDVKTSRRTHAWKGGSKLVPIGVDTPAAGRSSAQEEGSCG